MRITKRYERADLPLISRGYCAAIGVDNYSDEVINDEIYDGYIMLKFRGIDFMKEHKIGEFVVSLMKLIHFMHDGIPIIRAPSSMKNVDKERNPEMHQTKKWNVWHFDMEEHTEVDVGTVIWLGWWQ